MSDTLTMTLTEFLLARIAEDEAAAQEAAAGEDGFGRWWADIENVVCDDEGYGVAAAHRWEDAEHIIRHGPARVLAECQAKRRILSHHREGFSRIPPSTPTSPTWQVEYEGQLIPAGCVLCAHNHPRPQYPCETVRLLASVYADHPDYREEWQP